MGKYNVEVSYSINVEIEADSKDEAENIALEGFWEEFKGSVELENLECRELDED